MGNRRLAAGLVIVGALLAGVSACSNSEAGADGKKGANASDAQVRISPSDGTGKARPDQGVAVTATGGRLDQVSVEQNGRQVLGDFTPDHTRWKTKWALKPGASYVVNASAKDAKGKAATATSKFTTTKSAETFRIIDVTPRQGEAVGVGMPIIVTFDRAIANRDFVEKTLEVKSDKGDVGAWHWMSDQQVVYRTQKYWHPHQNVVFTAHLTGVRGIRGIYGTTDLTKSFKIGASNITVANGKTHGMSVTHDGVVKKFPISMGMGTTREYTTTSGIHLTEEKSPVVTMESPHRKKGDPGYYKEKVKLAVRITNLGEYVHQSVGEYSFLGKKNASHGCVRTSPTGAHYFYKIAQRGDVVDVTGTDRKLVNEQGNGWTFWTLSWATWLKGSALPH